MSFKKNLGNAEFFPFPHLWKFAFPTVRTCSVSHCRRAEKVRFPTQPLQGLETLHAPMIRNSKILLWEREKIPCVKWAEFIRQEYHLKTFETPFSQILLRPWWYTERSMFSCGWWKIHLFFQNCIRHCTGHYTLTVNVLTCQVCRVLNYMQQILS